MRRSLPGIAACATCGGSGGNKQKTDKKSTKNLLGVDETATLEVAAFDGCYRYRYNNNDGSVYRSEFPKAKCRPA